MRPDNETGPFLMAVAAIALCGLGGIFSLWAGERLVVEIGRISPPEQTPHWFIRALRVCVWAGSAAMLISGLLFATFPDTLIVTTGAMLVFLVATALGLPQVLGVYLGLRVRPRLPQTKLVTVGLWCALAAVLYAAWSFGQP